MVDHAALSREVRERVGKFLQRGDTRQLRDFVLRVEYNGGRVALFGGAVRDLLLQAPPRYPRDIDLVIECDDLSILQSLLPYPITKRTRFGGFRTYMSGFIVDAWTVRDTWGFRYLSEPPDIRVLPQTTFLNAEAIAVELTGAATGGRHVYDSGFFDAVRMRRLEINLIENPFPELCAVRALHLAQRTGFRLGTRLIDFIKRVVSRSTIEALIHVQLQHYRRIVISPEMLSRFQALLENGHDDLTIACRPPVQACLPFQAAGEKN